MSSRSNKRTGFSNNRGALNPKVTISDTKPKNPKEKDMFLDNVTLLTYYNNGSIWVPIGHVFPWTAGEQLYRGEMLYINQSDGKIYKTPTSGDMAIGTCFYDVAAANDTVYIVVSGMAYVLPESGLSLTHGYIISVSTSETGRVRNDSTVPSSTQHFRECGHVLENSSGNGALTRCVLHFN